MKKISFNLKNSSDIFLAFKVAIVILLIKILLTAIGELVVSIAGLPLEFFGSDRQIPEVTLDDAVFVIFMAPIIETLLGQTIPIKIGMKFTSDNKKLIVFSAIIFSLLHLPVIGFMVSAFAMGSVFSWIYIMKGGGLKAFKIVFLAHLIHNSIAFTAALTLQWLQ